MTAEPPYPQSLTLKPNRLIPSSKGSSSRKVSIILFNRMRSESKPKVTTVSCSGAT